MFSYIGILSWMNSVIFTTIQIYCFCRIDFFCNYAKDEYIGSVTADFSVLIRTIW